MMVRPGAGKPGTAGWRSWTPERELAEAVAGESVDRLERLTDLVLLLLSTRRLVSIREIVEQVPGYPDSPEGARQAFEKDKDVLRGEGIVITGGYLPDDPSGYGYRIKPDDYYLPDIDLSQAEASALNLVAALAGVGTLPTVGARGPSAAAWQAAGTYLNLGISENLEAAYSAMSVHGVLTFGYSGRPRRVLPALARFRWGRWYLVSWDLDAGEPRTFRMDRIEGRACSGAPPIARDRSRYDTLLKSFDAAAQLPVELFELGGDERIEVRVLVDFPLAGALEADLGPARVVERRDGGLVFSVQAVNVEAIYDWVLSLGDKTELLGPAEVRAGLVDRLRGLAGMPDQAPPVQGAAVQGEPVWRDLVQGETEDRLAARQLPGMPEPGSVAPGRGAPGCRAPGGGHGGVS